MNHTLLYMYKLSTNCTECFQRNFDKLQDLRVLADNQKIDAFIRFLSFLEIRVRKMFFLVMFSFHVYL